jgi:Domain of unknown function (DUF5671)
MRTIRRLYFYAVAFVSLEIVVWGLVGLARSFFCIRGVAVCGAATFLAQGLALILVGVPVFGFHWWMAERFARQDGEEHASDIRAVFLYGALLGTLIPVVQNGLSLLDRLVLQTVGLSSSQAILGPNQTWSDNLIAIVMNAIVAAYFVRVLHADWQVIVPKDSFTEIRRIYRQVWLIYGLGIVVAAVQQLLHFILDIYPGALSFQYRASGAHGLALVLVGLPLWYFAWKTVQDASAAPSERESLLRLGVLYLLSLAGVVTVLASAGVAVDVCLRFVFGESMTFSGFAQKLAGPLSIGIPLAGVWAYYGLWLGRAMAEPADMPRRAGMRRLYSYILSAIGLGATFTGLTLLLAFVVDAAIGNIVWADVLRPRLCAALATLSVGFPLWWLAWQPMQAEALAVRDAPVPAVSHRRAAGVRLSWRIGQGGTNGGVLAQAGDHARRSIIRKVYLYLALFVSVVGGMITAVGLLNLLLRSLFGSSVENLLQQALKDLEYLFLFVGLGVYHGLMLGKDGRLASEALAEKHAAYPVFVFDPGNGSFGQAMLAALHRQTPRLPAVIQNASQPVPDEAAPKAILVPGDLALNPPKSLQKWLGSYTGSRLIVPQPSQGWLWAGGIRPLPSAATQAAQTVRQLAEGQEVRQQAGASGWMIAVYIVAGLFGLEILGLLISVGISLMGG